MQVWERQTHCIRDPASVRMRVSLRGFSSSLPVCLETSVRFACRMVLHCLVAAATTHRYRQRHRCSRCRNSFTVSQYLGPAVAMLVLKLLK